MADLSDEQPSEAGERSAGKALLEIAGDAARARKPDRMLEALSESRFLDGVTQRLAHDWRDRLPRSEIEECVAVAVDSAYDAVGRGRTVTNIGAWIWKAASNKAVDRWNDDYQHRESLESNSIAANEEKSEEERELRERRLTEAIRIARSILPRIGQGQIIDVMTVVIDAVELGVEDLSPASIAETLAVRG